MSKSKLQIKSKTQNPKLLFILCALCIAAAMLPGCVAIPQGVEDAVHSLHKGNILIGEDYANLVIEKYEGVEEENRLLLLEKHLKLSRELDGYVKGKGGKLKWTLFSEDVGDGDK